MKKFLENKNEIIGVALFIIGLLLIFMGLRGYSSKINGFKAEIEQLKKSNEFKHELIRAYEDYYNADGDSTSYSKWQVIDSLYRSQI